MTAVRVVHYVNQFFGGLGGEEQANLPLTVRDGPVGPGRALQLQCGTQATIVASLIAGDNYMAEHEAEAVEALARLLGDLRPDVVVAGPAFDAGRYGAACAIVCRTAMEARGIPALTAMHPENPGLLLYRKLYVVPTGPSPSEMMAVLPALARLAVKLGRGEALGPAEVEGYLPRGIRRPGLRDRPGYQRALEMLKAKLAGRPYLTELHPVVYDTVPPAPPVRDLTGATLALITTGGIVPRGNPDRLVRGGATQWYRYGIAGLASLTAEAWECVHRGFYIEIVQRNPNYVVPLPVVRELQAQGVIGRLYPWLITTSGVGTAVAEARRMGMEIAAELRQAGVDGALLVAT